MAFSTTKQEEKNYQNFIRELTEISKKYKVAINSTGGVNIFDPEEDLSRLA